MKKDGVVSLKEKIGYATGDLACNLIFQMISFFLLYFYTDVFGISAAATSTLFLLARLWDAINDPIMGGIVDKTQTKWGKFRPYLLWGAIPFAIISVLCFTAPALSGTGKLIYAYITYISLGMIYTFVNVPYSALTSSMSQDESERAKISAVRMFFAIIGGLIVAIGVPQLTRVLGGGNEAKAYQQTMIIFAVLGAILLMVSFATTKERYTAKSNNSKFSLNNLKELLKANRPLQILCLAFTIHFGNNAITGAVGMYFFKYNMNAPDLLSTYMGAGIVTMLVALLFTPLLLKKMEKKNILILGTVISLFKYAVMYSSSVSVILTGTVIGSIGAGLAVGVLWGLIPDTIEYGEYKTGIRAEGITYAVVGFFFKLGMALGGLIPGFVLQWTGYVPETVQTGTALFGIQTLMSTIPIVLTIIFVIVMRFYKLDSKTYNKILVELNSRSKA